MILNHDADVKLIFLGFQAGSRLEEIGLTQLERTV